MKTKFILAILGIFLVCKGSAMESQAPLELLSLDVIVYEKFVQGDPDAMKLLKQALYEKGIVGIKGIPGYKEKVEKFIKTARAFSSLPEEVKESYAPDHSKGEMFLGYEKGKEKFERPDGRWVVDDLKVSYYAFVPEHLQNKWPKEVDLQAPFEDLGSLMSEMGEAVMKKIGLIGPETGISLEAVPRVGRMLYYKKSGNTALENPLWCGAHFDHGIFTALLPAFYFVEGESVCEPMEAGLFVKTTYDGIFKKIVADDPDILLFQVGEFGQLATNDAIRATEHRVHKASGNIERYTMALFFDAPMEAAVHSSSELAKDARYGNRADGTCTYGHWHEESFKRYLVQDTKSEKTN